ncbi:MAG: DUF2157 domain-containing protein [Planctomycetota bacterium]
MTAAEGASDSTRLDELADAFSARCRRGGPPPSVEDLAAANPELSDEIRDLFPLVARLEGAAQDAPGPSRAPLEFPGLELLDDGVARAGGMGEVYRARDRSLDRLVAVKTVQARLNTGEGRALFEREARAAARLDHPNIVKVFSFHPDHEPPYFVMQYAEGVPLQRACRGKDAGWIAAILAKIARALAYAHDTGIAHRDVKPDNILVDSDGEPRITDFGLAETFAAVDAAEAAGPQLAAAPRDEAGAGWGTWAYLAPELRTRGAAAGPLSDQYALGVTLYQLLTGGLPQHRDGVAALPQELAPSVPEAMQRICLRAMEPAPADRYPTTAALADELDRFLAGREVFARPTRYRRERGGRLRNHLTELSLWRRHRLIDTREMDRLALPYRRLLEEDSAWDELSRRFPTETALLRLGGWLAVLSGVLWLAFYWGELSRGQRVAALGVPCLVVNAVGWLFYWRSSRPNATAFLSSGSLLLPMLLAVVLAEYQLLRFPQAAALELFGGAAAAAAEPAPLPDGADAATRFAPTNAQLNAVAVSFGLYAAVLLLVVRARVFALWLGVAVYLCTSTLLLRLGLRPWLEEGRVAWALLHALPVTLSFVLLAGWLRDRAPSRAAAFFGFFPLPFAAALTLLARFGGEEWLGAAAAWDQAPVQLWLMLNGALYGGLAALLGRSVVGYERTFGELFLLLVPISLLVPTHVLFDRAPFLGTVGEAPLSAYALLGAAWSVALVAVGTRLRRSALAVPGLAGIAVTVWRATERHFESTLAWPLALALLGGVAMATGGVMALVRGRRRVG